jgi:hypothetical protein
MKIIVYTQLNNQVAVMIPCSIELTLVEIGIKDVPKDIPFWIIDENELPSTPQESWKLENMGDPSGYGKRK